MRIGGGSLHPRRIEQELAYSVPDQRAGVRDVLHRSCCREVGNKPGGETLRDDWRDRVTSLLDAFVWVIVPSDSGTSILRRHLIFDGPDKRSFEVVTENDLV